MFFKFAKWLDSDSTATPPTLNQIEKLFQQHPNVHLRAIEKFHATRPKVSPDYADPDYADPSFFVPLPGGLDLAMGDSTQSADHTIYPYLIENTRCFEVCDRVLRAFEAGENLATPDADTALWLRTTEVLFYRDLPGGSIGALTSWLRPDARAIRRNTYYRLLGLDLNHGIDGNRAYAFDKPAASNRDFVPTFEAFLHEVWRGVMNSLNGIGPNETDDAAIASHVQRLRDMLLVRRLNGNLRREEYWAVATMSWLHLTLAENTPLVRALKAEAESPAERLMKIGRHVGVPAHSRADNYFSMAFELSHLLSFIEREGDTEKAAFAPAFYKNTTIPGVPTNLLADIRTIITHWSGATGREIKSLAVRTDSRPTVQIRDREQRPQPLAARAGGGREAVALGGNGRTR